MSKHKEIEKIKAEKEHAKEIEKIKPEKELKIEHKDIKEPIKEHKEKDLKEIKEPIKEKVEHKEYKEKPEKTEHKDTKEPVKDKQEHKEIKEKPEIKERKDTKEQVKDKQEHKEVKEVEKQIYEKGGKELAEYTDPGGLVTHPVAGVAAPHAREAEGEARFKPVLEATKHKEHFDKFPIIEKNLHKEIKEVKDLKDTEVLTPPHLHFPGPGPEEARAAEPPVGEGTPEERLARLEAAVFRLGHFIGVDLRPDLTTGALNREADVAEGGAEGAETNGEEEETRGGGSKRRRRS